MTTNEEIRRLISQIPIEFKKQMKGKKSKLREHVRIKNDRPTPKRT